MSNIAAVPVKTAANQSYFLKNISRYEGDVEIVPVKCDAKLRLKDVLGEIATRAGFILQRVRVHRVYFKVDEITIEYPSAVVLNDKTPVLIDMDIPRTALVEGEDPMVEKLFMVTIPDSRTMQDVVRMLKLVYDRSNRTLMLLPENEYADWKPIGFEVSFAG